MLVPVVASVAMLPVSLASVGVAAAPGSDTRIMLDSIARMVDSTLPGVNDTFFSELMQCMGTGGNLVESHDASWRGFREYWKLNGTGDDGWGACTAAAGCHVYREYNATGADLHVY